MEREPGPLLGHLRSDVPPPPALQARVEASLTGRGLLRTPSGRRVRNAIAAAIAGLCLFGAGLLAGRMGGRPAASAGDRYALLLYDPAGFDRGIPEDSLVAQYRAWARSLGPRLDLGEKLGDREEQLLEASGTPQGDGDRGRLGGFFIVNAGSWEEAMRIARSCPHLKHGGLIAVRRIDET